jgi:hypothetical protein
MATDTEHDRINDAYRDNSHYLGKPSPTTPTPTQKFTVVEVFCKCGCKIRVEGP